MFILNVNKYQINKQWWSLSDPDPLTLKPFFSNDICIYNCKLECTYLLPTNFELV